MSAESPAIERAQGPVADRVSQVIAGTATLSSGYLVAEDLVLTARSALRDGEPVSCRLSGSGEVVPASVVWQSVDLDAALLHLEQGSTALPPVEPVTFGQVSGSDPVRCQVLAFPPIPPPSPIPLTTLDGLIMPVSLAGADQLTIELSGTLPTPGQRGWEGIGGAAVFADGLLVGVIDGTGEAAGGRPAVEAVAVAVFAGERGFAAAFNDHGAKAEVRELRSGPSSAADELPPAESEGPAEEPAAAATEPSTPDRLIDQVEWISDAPATRDRLSREHLARALTDRLRRLQRDEPARSFLIHVDGPWGSGKSTLLELVTGALKADFLVIRFDAWRQSLVGPPWWALLMALRRSVLAQANFARRSRLRWREANERGRVSYLIGILVVLAIVALVIVVFRPSFTSNAIGDLARTISAVIAVIATISVGVRALGKVLFWDSAAGARLFEQSQENPMESVADHFALLIAEANRPVIFLIDDLDRCSETYVVDLLDAIQTLIRDVPDRRRAYPIAPYFLVAADGAWIRRSYEERHSAFKTAVGGPGRPLGYLFLDKIFQLTLEVPAISPAAQASYLEWLLRGDSPNGEATAQSEKATVNAIESSRSEVEILTALQQASPEVRVRVAGAAIDRLTRPEIEKQTEHALQKFAPLLEPNPRAIKRFVNAYGMARRQTCWRAPSSRAISWPCGRSSGSAGPSSAITYGCIPTRSTPSRRQPCHRTPSRLPTASRRTSSLSSQILSSPAS